MLCSLYSTSQHKDGPQLLLVTNKATTLWYQIRYILSSLFMSWQGKKSVVNFIWLSIGTQSYTINLTLTSILLFYISPLNQIILALFPIGFLNRKSVGPGADQGGILHTSLCKLNLKEPYYRMSQPSCTRTTSTTASKVGYFFG